jgi:bifunctional non-homologous end joining protein LigD
MLRVLHPRLGFIEPQLPSLVDQPPDGKHWIHEIKHDGYRSIVIVERGEAKSTPAMDLIGLSAIPPSPAPLRIFAASQRSSMVRPSSTMAMADFESLRSAMRWKPQSIILYAFDLLHLDGKDLRQQTLIERRANLKALIGNDADNRIQFIYQQGVGFGRRPFFWA